MKRKMLAVVALVAPFMFAATAFAQDAASNVSDENSWRGIAAGIAIGLAALGGALGQGKAAAAALDGTARNPNASGKLLVPMILGLALIESLVILAWLVASGLAARTAG